MYTFVEAVLSGDPSAVGMVVGIVGKAEAATQLSALRKNGRHQLETVVMLAAKSGDVDMFHAVLRCLSRTLTNQQVFIYLIPGSPYAIEEKMVLLFSVRVLALAKKAEEGLLDRWIVTRVGKHPAGPKKRTCSTMYVPGTRT